ncbi:uncharacterized protein CCOS01_15722 [Colletotrichum costaricense]|uniref:Uncharacterized protein n=1 Tax=Colletotrichum costaricense TaxID=1209916 RepID=A0AAJ0DT48_9PEZI|nr:uncharacterized protein CCOS01_15722 [Colletotrichum costaricense]KAK1509206.1 hypothetical protein CCOS01_15722 [Colletotrichum costaricense]
MYTRRQVVPSLSSVSWRDRGCLRSVVGFPHSFPWLAAESEPIQRRPQARRARRATDHSPSLSMRRTILDS